MVEYTAYGICLVEAECGAEEGLGSDGSGVKDGFGHHQGVCVLECLHKGCLEPSAHATILNQDYTRLTTATQVTNLAQLMTMTTMTTMSMMTTIGDDDDDDDDEDDDDDDDDGDEHDGQTFGDAWLCRRISDYTN